VAAGWAACLLGAVSTGHETCDGGGGGGLASLHHGPGLVLNFIPKFHYVKRRFPITSKCRQMHGVLNVDKIKN
jgi:hypothetical protein